MNFRARTPASRPTSTLGNNNNIQQNGQNVSHFGEFSETFPYFINHDGEIVHNGSNSSVKKL